VSTTSEPASAARRDQTDHAAPVGGGVIVAERGPDQPPRPATRSSAVRGGPLPPLIKRNTMLLASTQAFVGMGTQMVPSIGAIIVMQITGASTLAGLTSSINSLSRFLVAYPIGWVADTLGRRAALWIGQSLCLVGTLIIAASVFMTSLPLLALGTLIFGLGTGAGQQLRLAAADLYPPARRAEGLAYVLSGSATEKHAAPHPPRGRVTCGNMQ
jgi:hypothetical protein